MEIEGVELPEEAKEAVMAKFNEELQARVEEQTSGLKAKVDELLAEKKKVKAEREEARLAAKLEAEQKAAAENDYKQLFESQKGEADTLRRKIEDMNASITMQKISAEAGKIAASLSKNTQRAELLQDKISQRLTIVDDEIRVTDESGQLTVSTIDELTASIRGKYDFLVDGTQASGGGAARSDGRAEERSIEISRVEFEGMSHAQRAEFFKSGGRIFDD
tara:strand:- start:124 stop:783 length:660 start_codon:yes stop_codon:yes gene_type:complete